MKPSMKQVSLTVETRAAFDGSDGWARVGPQTGTKSPAIQTTGREEEGW